ncbi:MAG: PKD domain-containing protein [Solirubrobacteraceae bacterium]
MSQLGIRRCLKFLFPFSVLLAFAITAPAYAVTGYGELAGFGAPGTGHGQFTEHGTDAIAFGVDPTDDSVYVGDEPEEHVFRVQKFTHSGQYLASTSFTVKGAGPEPESGIEGIAVDPVEKRFYVLAAPSRGDEEQVEVDPEVLAAGALYAFSTEPTGGNLEPAAGTSEGGVLTRFKPQSKTLGEALLEPSGIAVDPTNQDIVIMGKEDRGESEEPSLRVALERVSPTGTHGARYVDKAKEAFFESSEEATSPAVSATGKVYVIGGNLEKGAGQSEQIDEIPADFTSSQAPTPFVQFDAGLNELVTFPGVPAPNEGAALSIAPTGTLYVYAKIRHEGGAKGFAPGALEFSASGAELGWTGGQSAGAEHCTISFLGHPMVAAGGEEHVFMFDSNPEAPHVVEFGPGGTGCPTAASSALSATFKGTPVSGPLAPESEVKLSSTLTEANAVSVKWNFGDGTEAETTNQHQGPETTHKFASECECKVTETIRTDNLASPEFSEEVTLNVKSPFPVARFSAPEAANVGEVVAFDAKNSTDPNGSIIAKYRWHFGDGSPEVVTETPHATHTYTAAGVYTVELSIVDALGEESPVVRKATIKIVSSEPPPEKHEGPKETPTTTIVKPPPPPPPPAPDAELAGTSLPVTASGGVAVKVTCPAGVPSCDGTVTLRTLSAVSASTGRASRKKHRAAILTLATGTFTVAGGQVKSITLHLSARARALLARSHVLRVRATIVAHDSAGASHTAQTTVTLRASKAKRGGHR